MVHTDIVTEAGKVIKVRRLHLFELDGKIPIKVPGPYTVTISLASGRDYQQLFNMETPRTRPEVPYEDVSPNTPEWYDWHEYLLYQEGLLYYQKQKEQVEEYLVCVAQYIIENCIEDPSDIIEPTDYQQVYLAAICPEVRLEDLRAVARESFRRYL